MCGLHTSNLIASFSKFCLPGKVFKLLKLLYFFSSDGCHTEYPYCILYSISYRCFIADLKEMHVHVLLK